MTFLKAFPMGIFCIKFRFLFMPEQILMIHFFHKTKSAKTLNFSLQ